MKKIYLPFRETNHFSELVSDYLEGNPKLKPFYLYPPSAEGFREAVATRQKRTCNRVVLHEALLRQYSFVAGSISETDNRVYESIVSLLDENTYTVTTGHQLNIFTGPLYAIYKIVTVISLARNLEDMLPGKKIIPVFWMASEDHDIDEISSFRLFGKQLHWESQGGGAVGRLPLNGLDDMMDEVKKIIHDRHEVIEMFESAYTRSSNLTEATRKIMHHLFGKYGLVAIDGDDRALKSLFISEMETEILHEKSFKAVEETNRVFSQNYKLQVQPREINLFYMGDGFRERIVAEGDNGFSVLNTPLRFTREEIVADLHSHPEKYSPNVVLRPVYQEKILPNLANVGGPGELNYWLQFKKAFEVFDIPYPVVMLRNCYLLLDKQTLSKLHKLGITEKEVFQSANFLTLKVLEDSADTHPGTAKYQASVQKLYDELAREYQKLDPTLVPVVESEKQKVLNGLQSLETKGLRALKRKNEQVVNQLTGIRERLFPGGDLQERTENFLMAYQLFGPGFIDELVQIAEPFSDKFIILKEV